MVVTVVYDNCSGKADLRADWGFACVVEGLTKTILFDTGASGDILLANMGRLGIRADAIDALVLSHDHWDHTGGLDAFLAGCADVTTFVPAVFPAPLKKAVQGAGAGLVETTGPEPVCLGALTTGVFGGSIPEQGLCLRTAQGLVVITGCAHPGIVRMTEGAAAATGLAPHAVLGGFHLHAMDKRGIARVTQELKDLGVRRAGPCHCSGDRAREMMQQAFGRDYIALEVGARVELPEA